MVALGVRHHMRLVGVARRAVGLTDAAAPERGIEAEHDAGDHTIVIGRVLGYQRIRQEAAPLLYFRSVYGSFA